MQFWNFWLEELDHHTQANIFPAPVREHVVVLQMGFPVHINASHTSSQHQIRTIGQDVQFRCIVLKPGRQHVSTHGYTVMEQPVARDLLQSLAAGIMLVEPQQSSDNSLCSHPAASNTSQAGIVYHTNSKKRQVLAPNSKPKFGPKNEAIFGFA